MTKVRFVLRGGAFLLAALCAVASQARPVQGVSVTRLSSPVTPEISAQATRAAIDSMRTDFLQWLNEIPGVFWDTAGAVRAYHFAELTARCASQAKENSRFDGRDLVRSLTVEDTAVRAVVDRYNAQCDSAAVSSYRALQEALARNIATNAYKCAISTAFHAMGHIGAPLKSPSEKSDRNLIDEALVSLRDLSARVAMSSEEMVLSGKPGQPPKEALRVEARIDSIPLADMQLLVTLPSGRRIFAARTGADGKISLAGMIMPYAPKGTFLHIKPDLGSFVNVPASFESKDLGVDAPNQEQILILKVIQPVYSLKYAVNAASDIAVPQDFGSRGFVDKFLRDSCYMIAQSGTEVPDLAVEVNCQVSKYAHDEREETALKVEGKISIHALKSAASSVEKQAVIYQETFEQGKDLPLGLFFWQSANRLKQFIKSAVAQL